MPIEIDAPLRLETLSPTGVVCQAFVKRVSRNQVMVTCNGSLEIGMTVRLDGPDKLILAEVIGVERGAAGDSAILQVEHYLAKTAERSAAATA